MKRILIKLIILIPLALQLILVLSGCEDPVPNDYIPENYVEAYLLVGEPIKNIIVMKNPFYFFPAFPPIPEK